jgi:hypothetical protein
MLFYKYQKIASKILSIILSLIILSGVVSVTASAVEYADTCLVTHHHGIYREVQ